MLERVEIEIRAKFPVDAGKQIQIEARSDASGIVVRGMQDVRVLDEVDTDDEMRAGAKDSRGVTQEILGLARLEISNRRARKEADARALLGRGRERERPSKIGGNGQDADAGKIVL